MSVDALYIAYWSLGDPLTQSQCLPVLRALAAEGRRVALMTFEQDKWALSPEDRQAAKARLDSEGIRWFPLRYHKRPPVLSTVFDVARGTMAACHVVLKEGIRLLHGRGSVAALIAYVSAVLTRRSFFNDADGPLSEEYVDAGVWGRDSLGHRLAAWSEGRCFARADAVAVLTERRRAQVAHLVKGEVQVLPCAVDLDFFRRDHVAGQHLRRELGVTGKVLVYAGKSGGWYCTDAMLDFVAAAAEALGELTLLVLTTDAADPFIRGAAERKLRLVVRSATRQEMPGYLSTADVGLSFVLPAPSKIACSPVKNGEYLACGLPVVSTDGIGDYSALLRQYRVGVVVGALNRAGYEQASLGLRALLQDADLGDRCRQAALDEVGLQEVVVPRYRHTYDRLLGPCPGAAGLGPSRSRPRYP